MAGLEQLAQLLATGPAQQQAIAASDPYLQFKQNVPDQIGQIVLQSAANPAYSTKDKIVAGLLSGLTSGLFSGLSQDYQGRALDAYSNVVGATALGQPIERPSVLDPAIFRSASQQGSIFNIGRSLALQDQKNALLSDLALKDRQSVIDRQKEILGKFLDDPEKAKVALKKLAAIESENISPTDIQPPDAQGAPSVVGADASQASAERRNTLAEKLGSYDLADKVILEEEKAKLGSGIDSQEKQKLAQSDAVINDSLSLADALEQSGGNWLDLRKIRNFSAYDKEGLALVMQNLADRLTRARTGAALNGNEQKLYDRLVGGDITVDAKQSAALLRKLAAAESRYVSGAIDFSKKLATNDTQPLLDKYKSIDEKYGLGAAPQIDQRRQELLAEAKRRGLIK